MIVKNTDKKVISFQARVVLPLPLNGYGKKTGRYKLNSVAQIDGKAERVESRP